MLAAETLFEALNSDSSEPELTEFSLNFDKSELRDELHKTRNFGSGFHKFGFWLGSAL
ncbi:MAG TPA: electron transfer flavoprotein-ubiquinone oxidoreductase, partial [Gammaproteobacteria bacterium]|nr:electron transfer flavoprotein-ubiquinone oxidoreductase [Gammaproteobacteria bacterium]